MSASLWKNKHYNKYDIMFKKKCFYNFYCVMSEH